MPFTSPLNGDEIGAWLQDYEVGKPLDLHPRIRAVAFRGADQWHFYAGRIDVTRRHHHPPDARPAFRTAKLAFMEWTVEDFRNLQSAQGRTHAASQAGDRAMAPLEFNHAYLTLVGDRGAGGPHWKVMLRPDGQAEQPTIFDRDLMIPGQPLYPRLDHLAAAWLDLPDLVQMNSRGLYCFLPTFGPRFTRIEREGSSIAFAITGVSPGVGAELKVTARDRLDRASYSSLPVEHEVVRFELSDEEPPVYLEALLIQGRDPSDSFQESPSYCSWTAPVLQYHHTSRVELAQDVKRGECETVEFKEWVEPNTQNHEGSGKRLEVLRTVSAFANTRGGRLLIGVNDFTIVLGIEDKMGAWRASIDDRISAKLPAESKEAYARMMRTFLSDELRPETPASVTLEMLDGHLVCVIECVVFERVISLKKDGLTFIRRGSNNVVVSADAPELRAKLRRDPFHA